MQLTVIIPVHNEADSIVDVVSGVQAALAGRQHEVVIVDDGSTDATWSAIQQAVSSSPGTVGAIRLRRRVGKANALRAGFEGARGDVIITLDGDGQDDPAAIPELLAALDAGADISQGWKKHRQDPFTKRVSSRLFNFCVGLTTGVWLRDHNTGLKALKREVVDTIPLYGELHRFLAVLATHHGFVVKEIPVNHRPRRFGRSKYGSRVMALLDLLMVKALLAFDGRSHQVLGAAGLSSFVVGAAGLTYLAGTWGMHFFVGTTDYQPIANRPLTFYSLAALVFGAQLLSLAYVAGLVTHERAPRSRPFSVRARAGCCADVVQKAQGNGAPASDVASGEAH